MVTVNSVEGKDRGDVILYALSTCVWCKKTKRLLNKLGVAYKYIDVDVESDEDQSSIEKDLEKFNPDLSYPTIVIDNEKCIKGFDISRITGEFE